MLTGTGLRHVRKDLDLTCAQLADLCCVHVTTVSRWEAQISGEIHAEGFGSHVLLILDAIHKRYAQDRSKVSAQIRDAIQRGGPIGGVYRMLQIYYAKDPPQAPLLAAK
jgi:hypothetical protein